MRLINWLDYPDDFSPDPEVTRRAKIVFRSGALGAFFGLCYAIFYLLIGHIWGFRIIAVCSSAFFAVAVATRKHRSVGWGGEVLVVSLICGFTALSCVEGGLQGHAMAWLVTVPLSAHLLLGPKAAIQWTIVGFLAAAGVAAFELNYGRLPITYDLKWETIISAAGYLGLIVFIFMLSFIFERARVTAFSKMQAARAELLAANERLVHLNNEKNEFLGMAAHDLKNPLTIIVTATEMASICDNPEQSGKYLNNISLAATRMRNLITDLLDVNAIEQGMFVSNLEPCDMRKLVERSVSHQEQDAARKAIEIRVGVSEGLWAKADPAATMQILDNLISNALKFSPPNSTIHVHTLPEQNHILVSVRDEGPGISEADQKKLFQKFTRLTARPTGGESSTGLGLAIVKRLADAMGGSIQCHSAPGAGATFTLRLPICSAPPKTIPAPVAWSRRPDLKSLKN